MGAIKNYLINKDIIVNELSNYILQIRDYVSKETGVIYKNELIRLTERISSFINRINKSISNETVGHIEKTIFTLETNIKTLTDNRKSLKEKQKALNETNYYIASISSILSYENYIHNNNNNSEEYYKERISSLESKEKDLKEKISLLEPELVQTQKEKEEAKIHQKELSQELTAVKNQMLQMRQEQEEQKRRKDAQKSQKENIQNAFQDLNNYSIPMESEKTRLNWMFYIYALLCIITIILLIIYEYNFLCDFNNKDTYNSWMDYLPFYLPVPLSAGLLWAFIYQMNRAQRQLIILTDKLHHVKYIEGLLLAINTLSPDPSKASIKIQHTINSIIDKYLHNEKDITEEKISKELSKDQTDIKQLTSFIREIKEIAHK